MFLSIINIECKKISKGRSSSSRGSSRKTSHNPKPSPTSHSHSQQAQKPSLFGWQEKPVQHQQISNSRQSHSYPSSQTGLSGSAPKQQPTYQENVQRSHAYPQNSQQPKTNNQNHAYPGTNSMSGQSNVNNQNNGYPSHQGSGLSGNSPIKPNNNQPVHGYPASTGLSGNSATGIRNPSQAAPPYPGSHTPHNGNYPVGNNHHPPHGPPPPYPGNWGSSHGGYGGGYGGGGGYGHNAPGYFGNYAGGKGFGGMSRSGSALTGVGIAGAGVGTLLTGLALWNLARSTGHRHHTVVYDNRGQPVAVSPANNTTGGADSILGDLVNCTLTISNGNATEILAIPCSIATSFTPEADVKTSESEQTSKDNTTCTVTVNTKAGREFMTTISCSLLLNTAAENNVTEPPMNINNEFDTNNSNITQTVFPDGQFEFPLSLSNTTDGPDNFKNCSSIENGDVRDPINPCYAVTDNLTVKPLETNSENVMSTIKPIL